MKFRDYRIYIIVAAVLSVLIIAFLVLPRYRNLKTLEQEILVAKAEIAAQEEYFGKLRKAFDDLEENKDSLEKIDSALPEEAFLPELLTFLQKTASQSGLIIQKVSPSGSNFLDAGKKVKFTPVSLSLRGSYPALKEFLDKVEYSDRLIEVDKISFKGSTASEFFVFEVIVKIHSY